MAVALRSTLVLCGLLLAWPPLSGRQAAPPSVPRTWDDDRMADLELPLARSEFCLRQVTSEYYYRIPIRPVYRTYPVYARDREPAGYLERLSGLENAKRARTMGFPDFTRGRWRTNPTLGIVGV